MTRNGGAANVFLKERQHREMKKENTSTKYRFDGRKTF